MWRSVAAALQDRQVTSTIERRFGAKLGGTYLRIEFAQDVDGFWLEPHTDIGVKAFTFLLYLSKDPAHAGFGTDIYDNDKKWVGRSPFASDAGMIFVPSTITYHGFEPRKIEGVRKSLVINYVTNDWRAREQLAFPEQPVAQLDAMALLGQRSPPSRAPERRVASTRRRASCRALPRLIESGKSIDLSQAANLCAASGRGLRRSGAAGALRRARDPLEGRKNNPGSTLRGGRPVANPQYVYHMHKLSKTYPGGKQVLKDIWLSFLPGAKIGVVGLNGAGKSTLLKIMAGTVDDFLGEAKAADGIKVGYLPQEPRARSRPRTCSATPWRASRRRRRCSTAITRSRPTTPKRPPTR